jgi:hypothetical protein
VVAPCDLLGSDASAGAACKAGVCLNPIPALAAGVVDTLGSMSDLVALVDAHDAA